MAQNGNGNGGGDGDGEAAQNPPVAAQAPRAYQDRLEHLIDHVTQTMDRITIVQDTLNANINANANGNGQRRQRPKAINCRVFKIGENWANFSMHFVECVRAAYGYEIPRDQVALDAACVAWLPSRLEAGPTLIAYANLNNEDIILQYIC